MDLKISLGVYKYISVYDKRNSFNFSVNLFTGRLIFINIFISISLLDRYTDILKFAILKGFFKKNFSVYMQNYTTITLSLYVLSKSTRILRRVLKLRNLLFPDSWWCQLYDVCRLKPFLDGGILMFAVSSGIWPQMYSTDDNALLQLSLMFCRDGCYCICGWLGMNWEQYWILDWFWCLLFSWFLDCGWFGSGTLLIVLKI